MRAWLYQSIVVPIINAVSSVLHWLKSWVDALWDGVSAWLDALWGVIADLGNEVGGVFLRFGLFLDQIMYQLTGFQAHDLMDVWNVFWTGYTIVEFFFPVTACAAILLAGVQLAVTVRVTRWMIAMIPWGTANG